MIIEIISFILIGLIALSLPAFLGWEIKTHQFDYFDELPDTIADGRKAHAHR